MRMFLMNNLETIHFWVPPFMETPLWFNEKQGRAGQNLNELGTMPNLSPKCAAVKAGARGVKVGDASFLGGQIETG